MEISLGVDYGSNVQAHRPGAGPNVNPWSRIETAGPIPGSRERSRRCKYLPTEAAGLRELLKMLAGLDAQPTLFFFLLC